MLSKEREIRHWLQVIVHAEQSSNISKTCRYYGISRQTFYKRKRRYEKAGEDSLVSLKPGPKHSRLRTSAHIEEKVLHLRRTYHFGQLAISRFLDRYHDIKISPSGVYCILKRFGMNRLPKNAKKQSKTFKRYEKQVPGHHDQVDVKFLIFKNQDGKKVKRFQYTAIDDATRIKALKIYGQHTMKNAINFANYVTKKFPFRIHTIRTDNGHEFQRLFHWHIERELGIRHVYIRPRTPRLNGKVERSHGIDQQEFYQLLNYTDDIDLNEKLAE